jgi:hypothetical protein
MMVVFYAGIVKLTRNASRLPEFLATIVVIGNPALQGGLPIVPATVLRIAIAAKRVREVLACPDPPNLLIDILAKVGYVEDTTPVVESRVRQVFS